MGPETAGILRSSTLGTPLFNTRLSPGADCPTRSATRYRVFGLQGIVRADRSSALRGCKVDPTVTFLVISVPSLVNIPLALQMGVVS